MSISMPESYEEVHAIGHWQLMDQNGVSHLRIQCPKCRIWVDGPVFIEEDGVHLLETFPCDTHRIIEIAVRWKQILQEEASEYFNNLCIHIQIAHLSLTHSYCDSDGPTNYGGIIYFFQSGQRLKDPKNVVDGNYDAVLITIAPFDEVELEELERVICHELVHAAYPTAGGSRSLKPGTSMYEFCRNSVAEHWIDTKTHALLKKHGYLHTQEAML